MRKTDIITAALLAGLLAAAPAAADQPCFASPEEARAACAAALKAPDESALPGALGRRRRRRGDRRRPRRRPPDPHGRAQHSYVLLMGRLGWSMPIPIIEVADGSRFETEAGLEEILDRRMGENELAAIAAARAYVTAPREYGAVDRNGDGVPAFARRLISAEGQRDGLFWPTASGEAPSPLGPLAADEANHLRYRRSGEPDSKFKILTEQGEHAPGGPYDDVNNGRMIDGFAILAWPAYYGNSGIMRFQVSHLGEAYEADLGADIEDVAVAITAYGPDPRWSPVEHRGATKRRRRPGPSAPDAAIASVDRRSRRKAAEKGATAATERMAGRRRQDPGRCSGAWRCCAGPHDDRNLVCLPPRVANIPEQKLPAVSLGDTRRPQRRRAELGDCD